MILLLPVSRTMTEAAQSDLTAGTFPQIQREPMLTSAHFKTQRCAATQPIFHLISRVDKMQELLTLM